MRCQRDKRTTRSDDRSPLLVQSDVSIVSLSLDAVEKVFWGHDQLWDGPSNDTFKFDLSSGSDVSALYEPMLIAVADSATSHPYCGLVEKFGQIEIQDGDSVTSRVSESSSIKNTYPNGIFFRLQIGLYQPND